MLPADSEIVGGLDFAQLQTSALWTKLVAPKLATGDIQQKLNEFKAECGLDPMKLLTKISFGIKQVNDKPEGVVVMHGVPKAKALACLEKRQKAEKDDAVVTKDGDVYVIKEKGGDTSAMKFVDNTTLLMVIGANATKDGVAKAVGGTSALKTSPMFMDLYGKTKTTDTVWFLINGNFKPMADAVGQIGAKPKAIYGSINVTKDLAGQVRIRLGSADEATKLASMIKSQAGALAGSFVDKLDIGSDGADVTTSVAISSAKLDSLLKMAGAGGP